MKGTVSYLPRPDCKHGYTQQQLDSILDNDLQAFHQWFAGQTGIICTGESCEVSHGFVVYAYDVERYLRVEAHDE
jgi:hypothetical protein